MVDYIGKKHSAEEHTEPQNIHRSWSGAPGAVMVGSDTINLLMDAGVTVVTVNPNNSHPNPNLPCLAAAAGTLLFGLSHVAYSTASCTTYCRLHLFFMVMHSVMSGNPGLIYQVDNK